MKPFGSSNWNDTRRPTSCDVTWLRPSMAAVAYRRAGRRD
jgi:hypothetical protein